MAQGDLTLRTWRTDGYWEPLTHAGLSSLPTQAKSVPHTGNREHARAAWTADLTAASCQPSLPLCEPRAEKEQVQQCLQLHLTSPLNRGAQCHSDADNKLLQVFV